MWEIETEKKIIICSIISHVHTQLSNGWNLSSSHTQFKIFKNDARSINFIILLDFDKLTCQKFFLVLFL